MTIQRHRRFLSFTLAQRTARRSFTCLTLLALVIIGLPALSGAQQTCQPDGDVDQSGNVTAADALLVFQRALNLAQLNMCQQSIADVSPQPSAPDGSITAADALCIFQKALGLPSCFDSMAPPNESPIVDAGPDQTVEAGRMVILSGMASDPNGTIASHAWEQTAGTMVLLSGDTNATAMFTAPDVAAEETLTFRLTVTDDDGAEASAEISVTVIVTVGSEVFMSVSAGMNRSCGVHATGAVVCWGDNHRGRLVPPSGAFVSVSVGGHICGLRDTGTVECWGGDSGGFGRSTPPAGNFVAVSAGMDYTAVTVTSAVCATQVRSNAGVTVLMVSPHRQRACSCQSAPGRTTLAVYVTRARWNAGVTMHMVSPRRQRAILSRSAPGTITTAVYVTRVPWNAGAGIDMVRPGRLRACSSR